LHSALNPSHLGCDNGRMTDQAMLSRIDAYMQRGDALLARIDEHLERGLQQCPPEHVARGAALAARIEEHLARRDDVIVEHTRAYDDFRFSLRQDSLRNEKVLSELSGSVARLSVALTSNTDGLARHTDAFARHTDDMLAEIRAQREALFKMLDRLDGKGDQPPGAR
jgi:hypothetical protein